jgi:hypothetical protein
MTVGADNRSGGFGRLTITCDTPEGSRNVVLSTEVAAERDDMKTILRLMLAGTLALAAIAPAAAQTAQRTYENGPVWSVGYIETKPGMFDEYMAFVAGPWTKIQEAGKKRGDVLAYHVLAVDSPREHEPDVILLIEYKNMAVFDRAQGELDKDTIAAFGSTVAGNQAAVKREEIRVLRGGVNARELVFSSK